MGVCSTRWRRISWLKLAIQLELAPAVILCTSKLFFILNFWSILPQATKVSSLKNMRWCHSSYIELLSSMVTIHAFVTSLFISVQLEYAGFDNYLIVTYCRIYALKLYCVLLDISTVIKLDFLMMRSVRSWGIQKLELLPWQVLVKTAMRHRWNAYPAVLIDNIWWFIFQNLNAC